MNVKVDSREIIVPAGDVALKADIAVPESARGLVVFIHGTGSSRRSRRNGFVAGQLREAGFGTLLFDLLNGEEQEQEEITGMPQLDMSEVSRRSVQVVDWLRKEPAAEGLPLGLYGASTGAAAALVTAAARAERVRAVVSRGGRPDLAEEVLPLVKAPTLFIAGERDRPVLRVSEQAVDVFTAETGLEIVPGAAHLFEEPGAMERVATLAKDWFRKYLVR